MFCCDKINKITINLILWEKDFYEYLNENKDIFKFLLLEEVIWKKMIYASHLLNYEIILILSYKF